MNLDSFDAVFLAAAFLVPGFIWSSVLSMLLPRKRHDVQLRLLEFLALSCINYGLWSWALYLLFKGPAVGGRPHVTIASTMFLIVFVSPIVLGLTSGWLGRIEYLARLLERFGIYTIRPEPTAWDYHFSRSGPCWVLVKLKDGSEVYGLYGSASFAGDDPHERDLFIEAVFRLLSSGEWAPVEDSAGILIKGDQIASIEFRKLTEVNHGE